MPAIDGRRLCRYVKTAKEFENMKVIVLSPLTLDGTIQLMDVRADAYVAKGYITDVAEHVDEVHEAAGQGPQADPGAAPVLRLALRAVLDPVLGPVLTVSVAPVARVRRRAPSPPRSVVAASRSTRRSGPVGTTNTALG